VSAGAELSQRCYNIAIKACGSPPGVQLSRSQLDLGYALLEEMQRGGFGPDLRTYTSLYILGAQAKEGERALDLYLVIPPTIKRDVRLEGYRPLHVVLSIAHVQERDVRLQRCCT